MNTLFAVNINWFVLLGIAFITLFVPGITIFTFFAILISFHQFLLLFYSVGHIIPTRYLFGSFMCLQLLLGPTLAYNIEITKVQMQVPESEYFSYVIPAVIFFIIGLHIFSNKLEGEVLDKERIVKYIRQQKNLPFYLIAIGFLASYISFLFSSELAFLIYLLGGLKYVGVFMIIIGSRQLKLIPLVLVYGSIIVSSLKGAMFHDLLTWVIFLGLVFAIKYKPSVYLKSILVVAFILLTIILQVIKKEYRTATWQRGSNTGFATLSEAYVSSQGQGGIFDSKSLEEQIVRINQGYIVSYIMKTVPNAVPYSEGEELKQILTAAILPRFLAPNKLTAGNLEIFNKYTRLGVERGTSMGLSSIGDAYINFGVFGGCIFMFVLGLLYSEVLKAFHRYSKYYPVLLLFTPLVFYYPIRPDCELQTILGHLVKSCFLIYVVFLVWRRYFRESRES